MSDTELGDKCHHDPCHCKPDSESAVTVGKSVYCSQGCADGNGCDHPHCDCSSS